VIQYLLSGLTLLLEENHFNSWVGDSVWEQVDRIKLVLVKWMGYMSGVSCGNNYIGV
jgi:hypothetical protein